MVIFIRHCMNRLWGSGKSVFSCRVLCQSDGLRADTFFCSAISSAQGLHRMVGHRLLVLQFDPIVLLQEQVQLYLAQGIQPQVILQMLVGIDLLIQGLFQIGL